VSSSFSALVFDTPHTRAFHITADDRGNTQRNMQKGERSCLTYCYIIQVQTRVTRLLDTVTTQISPHQTETVLSFRSQSS